MNDYTNSIPTIKERDKELGKYWALLADVPVNPETEQLEEPFLHFPIGTDKLDIWHWFDDRYSKGVSELLYQAGNNAKRDAVKWLLKKKGNVCNECDSELCMYNPEGICLFPLFKGREPEINDEGCSDCWRESDLIESFTANKLLDSFIEKEIPFRLTEHHELDLNEYEKIERFLSKCVLRFQNDYDLLFNYDVIDAEIEKIAKSEGISRKENNNGNN